MIVISTGEAISDLLDQRSAIYSDRVRVPQHTGFLPLTSPSPAIYTDDRAVSLLNLGLRLTDLTCLLCVTQDGSP